MSAGTPLAELLQALEAIGEQPRNGWELAVLVAALALAWWLARLMRRRWESGPRARGGRVPLPGVPRLVLPFLALAFLGMGSLALRAAHLPGGGANAHLLRFAAALLATLGAVRLLGYATGRAFPGSSWIARFERISTLVAAAGLLLYLTGVLADVVDWLRATRLPVGTGEVSLLSILQGATTTSLALIGALWVGSLIDERIGGAKGLPPNLRTVLGRSARALLVAFAVLIGLALSGIDLTILSVFGGALGVGLGLGLQRIASNYVSGFILLLDRGLRIGDFVSVDKHAGEVREIGARYTVLLALDGTEAIVPNEVLVSSPVVNYTLANRRVMLSVRVALPADVDLDLVLGILRRSAARPRVLSEPEPAALLVEFHAATLVFEIDFWIADPENGRMNVQSEVSLALLRALREHGIPLAVPASEVRTLAARSRDAESG